MNGESVTLPHPEGRQKTESTATKNEVKESVKRRQLTVPEILIDDHLTVPFVEEQSKPSLSSMVTTKREGVLGPTAMELQPTPRNSLGDQKKEQFKPSVSSMVTTKREGVLGPTAMELQPTPRNSIVDQKKEGVSGESYDTNVNTVRDITLPEYEKDAESKSLIKKAIKNNEFLSSGLTSVKMVDCVVNAMYTKEVPDGSSVIKEGEHGSHLYVSAEGEFEVYKGDRLVNTLGPGNVFGELAILYNSRRNATIKAIQPSKVWVLDRKVFHQIMMKSGLQRLDENIKFLRSVPLLSKLDKGVLTKISDLLRVNFYQTGTEIVKQGDEGSFFYIISGGTVTVTKENSDGTVNKVGKLREGEYFGEAALLNNDRRLATCTADSPGVECLTLDRRPFKELLGDLEELKNLSLSPKPKQEQEDYKSEFEHIKLEDLDILGTIGTGGFGRVELAAYKKDPNLTFALKQLKKVHVVENHQQVHVFNEKLLMSRCRSQFICRMYKTFKDRKYLYFLMEACLGGDVWTTLTKCKSFDEDTARFMTACVVEAFDYLHSWGITYRDLKPENLLLDSRGYVKLVDFGFAKKLSNSDKTWTFAGTPEYIPPEIILNRGHDRAVDYWELGILIYELLVGQPPFRGRDHMRTYNMIIAGIDRVPFPKKIPKLAQLLIKKLCRACPSERLGYQKDGVNDIRNHTWFKNFDWPSLARGTMKAPLIPKIRGPRDMSNCGSYSSDKDVPPDDISGWDQDF